MEGTRELWSVSESCLLPQPRELHSLPDLSLLRLCRSHFELIYVLEKNSRDEAEGRKGLGEYLGHSKVF